MRKTTLSESMETKAGRIRQQQRQVGKAGSTSQYAKRRQAENQADACRGSHANNKKFEDILETRMTKLLSWKKMRYKFKQKIGGASWHTSSKTKLEGPFPHLWWQTNPFNDTALHDPKCRTDNQILSWTNCQCKCRPIASQHFVHSLKWGSKICFCENTHQRTYQPATEACW